MSNANMAGRNHRTVSGSAVSQSAGGSLAIGPFPVPVIVVRFGALVTTTTTTGATSLTSSPNVGSVSIPSGAAADKVYVTNAKAAPAAQDGTQPGQYVLPVGDTLTVTGAAVGGSSGAYRIFIDYIEKPLVADSVDVIEV